MVVLLVTLALAMHTDPEGNEPPADAPVAAEPEQPLVETAPEEPVAPPTSETVVRSNKPRSAASASTVRDRDLMLRPHPRPADILQTVPGFYVVRWPGRAGFGRFSGPST